VSRPQSPKALGFSGSSNMDEIYVTHLALYRITIPGLPFTHSLLYCRRSHFPRHWSTISFLSISQPMLCYFPRHQVQVSLKHHSAIPRHLSGHHLVLGSLSLARSIVNPMCPSRYEKIPERDRLPSHSKTPTVLSKSFPLLLPSLLLKR
jgi:hypothetical protein